MMPKMETPSSLLSLYTLPIPDELLELELLGGISGQLSSTKREIHTRSWTTLTDGWSAYCNVRFAANLVHRARWKGRSKRDRQCTGLQQRAVGGLT